MSDIWDEFGLSKEDMVELKFDFRSIFDNYMVEREGSTEDARNTPQPIEESVKMMSDDPYRFVQQILEKEVRRFYLMKTVKYDSDPLLKSSEEVFEECDRENAMKLHRHLRNRVVAKLDLKPDDLGGTEEDVWVYRKKVGDIDSIEKYLEAKFEKDDAK